MKWFRATLAAATVCALVALISLPFARALDPADQSGRGRFALQSQINHLGGGAGPLPVANSCTGFALLAGGGDLGGKVTFTSGTTCTITFGTAFLNAPACTVTPGSAASTTLATTTTTGLNITFGSANTAFSFTCVGL
jgi:hypothetical protein